MSWTPPRSSSNTVGSVRTGMSRSRHAATTLARSTPGAEGIAMITSSGDLRSRISSISSVEPSTFTPAACMPRLRGSSSTKPIAAAPRRGFSRSSRTTICPPEPAPDDQHPPRAAAACGPVGSLGDHPPRQPAAAHQDDGEQEVEHDHRPRQAVGVGLGEGEDGNQQPARHRGRADDRPQVGELEVAPPLLVQAQDAEHDRLADGHEGDRPGEHGPVAVGDATRRIEEAQAEGQREGRGGEQGVGSELQQPAAVDVLHGPPAQQGPQTAAPGLSPAFVLARRRVIEAGHSGECNADAA